MKKHFVCLFVLVVFISSGASAYASQNNVPRYGVVSANFDPPHTMPTASCHYIDGRLDEGADACSVLLEFACEEDFQCKKLVSFETGLRERIIRLYSEVYGPLIDGARFGYDAETSHREHRGWYRVDDRYFRSVNGGGMGRYLSRHLDGVYSIDMQIYITPRRFSHIYFYYDDGVINVFDFHELLDMNNDEVNPGFRCVPEDGVLQVPVDELRLIDESGGNFYDYVFEKLCGFNDAGYEYIHDMYQNLERPRYLQNEDLLMNGYATVLWPVFHGGELLQFSSYLIKEGSFGAGSLSSPIDDYSWACYENCNPYIEMNDRRSYPRDLDAYLRDVDRQAVLSTADVRAMLLVIPVMAANVQHYNNIAYYLEQSGQYSESILLLNEVVATFPNRTVAYINLGDAYWGLEKYSEARQAYQTYIHLMRENNREQRIPQRVLDRVGD